MPVHDIDVEHAGSGLFHGSDFLAQPSEIRGQYGWENLDHWRG
jgi:hypothetical protein